jgi:HNH endonuclease
VIYENLTGKTFGKYKVIKQAKSKGWKRRWLCMCSCGKTRTISTEHLNSGKRTGCNACNNGNLKRPFEGRYKSLCALAKGRCSVDLTYEEYLSFTKHKYCHYCGIPLSWKSHGYSGDGHHLDRKDNSVGYTKSNCVVCCSRCNRAKSDHFTYDEWKKIGGLIRTWRT